MRLGSLAVVVDILVVVVGNLVAAHILGQNQAEDIRLAVVGGNPVAVHPHNTADSDLVDNTTKNHSG